MIILTDDILTKIKSEGERSYPDECCGALTGLFGDLKDARDIFPIENSRESVERYHRFTIEAEDYMKAESFARSRGEDLIGFYHSHPDNPARPSPYDKEHALPFYSYLIVSVNKASAGDITSWELSPDRADFYREEIKVKANF